jgi:hypothetical protein
VQRTNFGELAVSPQGLGCMGMGYGAPDWGSAVATVRRAIDLGVTFIDTADVTKFGMNRSNGNNTFVFRGEPGYVDMPRGCEHSGFLLCDGTTFTIRQPFSVGLGT